MRIALIISGPIMGDTLRQTLKFNELYLPINIIKRRLYFICGFLYQNIKTLNVTEILNVKKIIN